ncbi:MAG: serine hydrolase [Alphaproteobacteria bacterium]|nr:serine hydrolase [Alphaproteobacteria bacterium]
MTRLMDGFPPAPAGQVTLANWRTPPFNTWAFHHVRELIATADIPNDPAGVRALPVQAQDLERLVVAGDDGRPMSFDAFLGHSHTDGIVVLHKGRIVFERYANGMTAHTPHILMSVSKSMLGLLAGTLVARGEFAMDRQVTEFVPEVASTAYRGATLRDLLDMRAGIAFDEDYLATSGPIIEYRKSTGWNPLGPGEAPSDLRSFYRVLDKASRPHGGRFDYISPNTDLLGWAIERATGRRYADLMSERLWKPMGAETSAYITVDRLGAPRCAGGMCTTTRDLARVGQLMVEDGRRDGVQVLPAEWIGDIEHNGDPEAWDAGNFLPYFPGAAMHYRSKWYVDRAAPALLFGLGINGQNLFVDRARQLVIAKHSSQLMPLDAAMIALTGRAVTAIRNAFG